MPLKLYLLWHLNIADSRCILIARGIRTAPDRSERRALATQMRVEHSHAIEVKAELERTSGTIEPSFQPVRSLGDLVDLCDQDWPTFLVSAQVCFPALADAIGQELHAMVEPDVVSIHDSGMREFSESALYAQKQLNQLARANSASDQEALVGTLKESGVEAVRRGTSVAKELLDRIAVEWPSQDVHWESVMDRAVRECDAELSELCAMVGDPSAADELVQSDRQ